MKKILIGSQLSFLQHTTKMQKKQKQNKKQNNKNLYLYNILYFTNLNIIFLLFMTPKVQKNNKFSLNINM